MTETPQPTSPTEPPKSDVDIRWLLRMSSIVILVGVFVSFGLQNSESVEVEFLWWSFEAARIVLLVGSALVGIAIWELAGFVRRRRNKDR